jgi:hypothetical protein
MSNMILDGRALTDAERVKLMADMEREEVRREADERIQRLDDIARIRRELDIVRSRAAQFRADLYAAEARIGELRGELDRLGVEWRS